MARAASIPRPLYYMLRGMVRTEQKMARVGVDFSQVSRAALALREAEKPITVDNVRIQLGGTGSKSTIAPLLKRWKAENAESVEQAHPRLPPDLLQSVQRLYDTVQHRFQEDLDAVKIAAAARGDELTAENLSLTQQLADSEQQRHQLDDELSDTKSQVSALKEQLATERAERRDRDFAYVSLEQRSNERISEIDHLREQLVQAHQQFSHFEAAVESRWEKDRASNESRLNAAVQVEERLRAQLQDAKKEAITFKTRFDQLNHSHIELVETCSKLQTDAEHLRQTCAIKEHSIAQIHLELRQCRISNERLQATYDTVSARAHDSETRLAVSTSQLALLQTNLDSVEARANMLHQEQLGVLRKHAECEAELRACRQARKLKA